MAEEEDPGVSMIELQEEFMQHMERGGRKITLLAVIATLAGAYFAVSYFLQLVIFPYVLGITTQTVNLVDPGLMAVGALSLVVSLLWFYAGFRDLLFGRKMGKRIREIRKLQALAAERYGLSEKA
ncbi:MAG TPA: hypothetical protein VJR06_01305 [Nitrososphaerales archaeon]|nr:hypothetical protein [Nitrososphaerales archaeon]